MATRQTRETDDGLTDETALQIREREPDTEQTETDAVLESMRAMLAELPSAAVRLKLYKLPRPGSGKTTYQWCEDFMPDEFQSLDWEEIRHKWGPGTYQMRLIGPKGVVKNATIEIASINTAPMETTKRSELSEVLASLAENQARMLDALTQRPDPGAQMRETLALMATMREALGIGATAQNAPMSQMEMMREVFSMVREAKSAAKELADETVPVSDDPMAMLPKLLDVVGAALKTQQIPVSVAPIQVPQSIANPIQRPEIQANIQPEETEQTNETPEQTMLMIHVHAILSMAKKKVPVEIAGDYIASNLPDEFMRYLDSPDMFDRIKAFIPAASQHEEWLKGAIEHAKSILDEEMRDEGEAA